LNRRDTILGALAAACVPSFASGQDEPASFTRKAVVIGVDRPARLPTLRAAVSGAQSVSAWLRAEGFEVAEFVDTSKPVIASDIKDAVMAFVNAGTTTQLVIYFAGHGCVTGQLSEFWLLSNAMSDSNEAVCLRENCDKAEQSGIRNVVFISDACRSRADSMNLIQLHGTILFPTLLSHSTCRVDQFLATRVGSDAYEIDSAVNQAAAEFQGIYTTCFLEAFKHPRDYMVKQVAGRAVIPNRCMSNYLAEEVPKRAQAINISIDQHPDSKIYSDEPTYIAHVSGVVHAARQNAPCGTVSDVYHGGIEDPRGPHPIRIPSRVEYAKDVILKSRSARSGFPGQSGFTVVGTRVTSVVAAFDVKTEIHNSADNTTPAAIVTLDPGARPAVSAAIRFADGTGTVLAALHGYAGNVVVDGANICSVAYEPTANNPRRPGYEAEAATVEQYHAEIAAQARFGIFTLNDIKDEQEGHFAGRVRMLKSVDPTLGLYAAYAYAEAGLVEEARSVGEILHSELNGADLFDVALLAGVLNGVRQDEAKTLVPFCPMLSQGWSLLRTKSAHVSEALNSLRDHLKISLWLRLDAAGMTIVEQMLKSGRVH
jgi:Caspase domain